MRPTRTVISLGLLSLFLLLASPACTADREETRASISLNGVWAFYPEGGETRHDIRVPSFWDAPQDYGFPAEWLHMRHGIYRRTFTVPAAMADKAIFLEIDRVSVLAKVFVNGQAVGGETTGGYLMMMLPYKLDITALVDPAAANELEIRVWGGQSVVHGEEGFDPAMQDFPADAFEDGKLLYPWGVDHYDGRRGLCGDVRLSARPKVHIADIFVIPQLNQNGDPSDDRITVRTTITNTTASAQSITLSQQFEPGVEGAGVPRLEIRALTLEPGASETVEVADVPWGNARYWWPHDPFRYAVVSSLTGLSGLKDRIETRFGFREFYSVDGHFALNGTRVNLRAESYEFSWHEGYRHGPATAPVLSTAELIPALQERLVVAYKDLNLNTLRVHKASGIERIYDLADSLGIFVIDEAPLWEVQQRTDERAAPAFEEWIRRMVEARRNHPSIILWSIANECWGSPIPERLYRVAKEADPTRLAYHQGIWPIDFKGDLESVHYTGGYPMGAFNTADLYGVYTPNPDVPKGEGESLFADGWPLKNPDGTLSDRRTQRGEVDHPDAVSQAEWLRGVARTVRAMRFAELDDVRSYMNWIYAFESIEADIPLTWADSTAPGIQPIILRRPVLNVFDDRFPALIENAAIAAWRAAHAPVAVFDVAFNAADRLGVEPEVFQPGAVLERELVVYNDVLSGGPGVTVHWELMSHNAVTGASVMLYSGSTEVDVPYGEKRFERVATEVPQGIDEGTWLVLKLRAAKEGTQVFEEENRLGAIGRLPEPHLTVRVDTLRLGSLTSSDVSQLRKITLVNTGGGLSELWTAEGSDEVVQLTRTSGNLRGEQEVFFRVDVTGLAPGTHERTVTFSAAGGSSATVSVAFEIAHSE